MKQFKFTARLITARVDEKEYRLIKSKLALAGETFSSWLRKQIKEYING